MGWSVDDEVSFARQVHEAAIRLRERLERVGLPPRTVDMLGAAIERAEGLHADLVVAPEDARETVRTRQRQFETARGLMQEIKRRVRVAYAGDDAESRKGLRVFLVGAPHVYSVEGVLRDGRLLLRAAQANLKRLARVGITAGTTEALADALTAMARAEHGRTASSAARKTLAARLEVALADLRRLVGLVRLVAKAEFHSQPDMLAQFRRAHRS